MDMNIEHLNITNLTSLWKNVIKDKGHFVAGSNYDYSLYPNSDWPNRLWFHEDISPKRLAAASKTIKSTWPLIIPYWDIYENSDSHEVFLDHGFELKSEQYGMFLKLNLDQQYDVEDIYFEKVSHEREAVIWSEIFSSAFGYRINKELLITDGNVDVLLAYSSGKPVGTLMLHSSAPLVMGVHSMGIAQYMQRKGYGGKIMKKALNEIQKKGFQWVTLQASKAGLGLYQKLEFQQQFLMRSYLLQQ